MPDNIRADDVSQIYSLEAEQAVLGSVLVDPSCLSRVAVMLKPDSFYLKQHKDIFTAMLRIDASGGGTIDPVLLLDELKSHGVFDDETGKTYLFRLSQNVPSTANVEVYAKIVRERYYVRALMNAVGEINEAALAGQMNADELLDMSEQKIYDIRQGRQINGPTRISDILSTVYEELYRLENLKDGEYAGLNTGFSQLDKMITGLNRSDLILIGARPAMGKTSFALNIARNVAFSGKKVVFFSLEMSKEQLAQRILSTEARIESQKFRTGNLSPKGEWPKIMEATLALNQVDLYFDDTSNITVPEMKARLRQLKGVDCVIIDYLQLMQSGKHFDSRVLEVSDITRSLKLMAKDLNIPVVTCSQLARRTEEKGRSHKPQLSDLRESGSIEQDADIVMMLYREDYYKDDKQLDENAAVNEAEVLVQKNRHGPTGSVKLAWSPEYTLFTTREYVRDEPDD